MTTAQQAGAAVLQPVSDPEPAAGAAAAPVTPATPATPRTVWTPAETGEIFKSGVTVVDKPQIIIPVKVLDTCDAIQKRFSGKEFSIVCKGRWTEKGFEVSEDYRVPIQRIDTSSVYYDQENISALKQAGYTCVIHSHPFNMASFSGTDKETICTNFPCSVLYNQGKFPVATVRLDIRADLKLQLELTPRVERVDTAAITDDELKNITELYPYRSKFYDDPKDIDVYDKWGRKSRGGRKHSAGGCKDFGRGNQCHLDDAGGKDGDLFGDGFGTGSWNDTWGF